MDVIHSLKKQNRDLVACLKQALDQIALPPMLDLFRLLFPAKAP